MSLYARYKFKQRPDAVSVRGLVAAELEDRLAPGGLPGAAHDLRRQQARTGRAPRLISRRPVPADPLKSTAADRSIGGHERLPPSPHCAAKQDSHAHHILHHPNRI